MKNNCCPPANFAYLKCTNRAFHRYNRMFDADGLQFYGVFLVLVMVVIYVLVSLKDTRGQPGSRVALCGLGVYAVVLLAAVVDFPPDSVSLTTCSEGGEVKLHDQCCVAYALNRSRKALGVANGW